MGKSNIVALDHPMHSGVRIEVTDVGALLAADLLERNKGNRNLRRSAVDRYARDMKAGNWHMSAEPIKVDWNGRLMDGQHRLHAVLESKTTVKMMIAWGLDPDAQIVIDAGAKRSASDALRFRGESRNTQILGAIARIAVAWDAGKLRTAASSLSDTLTTSETLEWLDAHPEAHEAAAFASRYYKSLGMTPSALGFAALKLLAVEPEAAIEFVASTAEFRTDGANDPRAVLLRTLQRLKNERVRMTPALQIALVFRAWNAWRANKAVSSFSMTSRYGAVQIPEPK